MTRLHLVFRPLTRVAALAAVLALSACASGEPATRAATSVTALDEIVVQGSQTPAPAPQWKVRSVSVEVPQSLHVSEANLYFPIADIVWRGDARGDRYAQVDTIVTAAARRATAAMTKGRAVAVEIEMKRFHALTEKARYSVGGSYGMKFLLTVRDARSGEILDGPRLVNEGHPASGGDKALEEEARGLSQKVVITEFLTDLIGRELARPPVPGAAPARRDLLTLLR